MRIIENDVGNTRCGKPGWCPNVVDLSYCASERVIRLV